MHFLTNKTNSVEIIFLLMYLLCLQFYDNLVEVGTRFLTLDEQSQAGIMYHSLSNILGIKLRAHRPYGYTGFIMRYVATGWLVYIASPSIKLYTTTNISKCYLHNIISCNVQYHALMHAIKLWN